MCYRICRQFRPRDHWTRKLLETHQAHALHSLRDYAYAHSPFYQWFHHGLTGAPLHELPVLTKALLMEHFDDLVTDRAIRLEEVKAHLRDLPGDERFLVGWFARIELLQKPRLRTFEALQILSVASVFYQRSIRGMIYTGIRERRLVTRSQKERYRGDTIMDTREHAPRNAWLQSKRLTWVLLGVLAIGALFLITGHAAQLLSLLPFAILLLCPLMMLFMMKGMGGGQGHHERHDGPDQQGRE